MKYILITLMVVGVTFIGVRGVQYHNETVTRLKTPVNASNSTLSVGDNNQSWADSYSEQNDIQPAGGYGLVQPAGLNQ